MKGDFSRRTFNSKKHYNAVLKQQGRVDIDADWNEQTEIRKYIDRTHAGDTIGPCGAPEDNAGFEIRVKEGKELYIGTGRYYADGILCENDSEIAYSEQPDLPAAPDIPTLLQKGKTDIGLVYLDVWDRHITAIDDPLILEKALGGPDTATRVKTIWQVKVLPVTVSQGDPDKIKELERIRKDLLKKIETLEAEGGDPQEIETLRQKLVAVEKEIAELSRQVGCDSRIDEWNALIEPDAGQMNAKTIVQENPQSPCLIPPGAGYKGLENQLYRVEIHQGGPLGKATFKWSRDNGTVVTAIKKISGKVVAVQAIGPDEMLGFSNGQWVEVLDDALELNGMPGQLLQIENVNRSTLEITLSSAPKKLADTADGIDKKYHPKLRRWFESGNDATETGIPVATGWIELEAGIRVQFADAPYKTGNYWLIPARAATGEIEWPPYEVPNEKPIEQAPLGIHHHYCRLALVQLEKIETPRTLGVLEDGEFVPDLAESYEVDDSYTKWRFQLRSDVSLPDGSELTADDVVEVLKAQMPATINIREFDSTGRFTFAILLENHDRQFLSIVIGIPIFNEIGSSSLQVVEDCRPIFTPLTRTQAAPIKESGINIEAILCQIRRKYVPLKIDDAVVVKDLIAGGGIHFVCNAPIDPAAVNGRPVGKVTLELPYPLNNADRALWGRQDGPLGFAPIIISGSFKVMQDPLEKRKNHSIFWEPTDISKKWLADILFAMLGELRMPQKKLLIRIEMFGNLIWGAKNRKHFLDANLFAEAAENSEDPIMPIYPSGNSRRGGILQMRFYIKAREE
jgi:hypothetical protein